MHSNQRRRSEYEFELSASQLEAFLEIAAKQDKPIEELVLTAVDQYIQREKALWDQRAKN